MARRPTRTPLNHSKRSQLNVIDYTLAKRALLRDAQVGLQSYNDLCDAHPELIRAARNVGEPTRNDCPVCGKDKLVLLAYVYGDALKQENGRLWSLDTGLRNGRGQPGRLLLRRRGLPDVPVEPPARGLHGSPRGHRLNGRARNSTEPQHPRSARPRGFASIGAT